MLLFVYGTLRKEFPNHPFLDSGEFIGRAVTAEQYAMYVDSTGLPYLVKDETVSRIVGEVYAVNRATLKACDAFEGHPNWYRREQAMVETNNVRLYAWIYFYIRKVKAKLVTSGDYAMVIGD